MVMARVRDARVYDVQATTIKEKEKEKENTGLTYKRDFYKPKSNPNLCTNLVGVPVLCQVMLDPL